jgi:hypothetical protein
MESEQILEALDNLVKLGSETALEFGWLANQYFEIEKADLVAEFGSEDAALHEAITFIHDREAEYIVARSTVADRMRVTRYMTREKYLDIVDETHRHPSFHQLRACLVTDKSVVVKDKTDEIVSWCVFEGWPTVAEIREHRDGKDPATIETKHWNRLVKCALVVSRDFQPSALTGRYDAVNAVLQQDNLEDKYALS